MLPPPIERLIVPLQELLALEEEITAASPSLRERARGFAPAVEVTDEIEALACQHARALRERLQEQAPATPAPCVSEPRENTYTDAHPASTALRDAYALVQRAVIGYSAMAPIAHRARDSWVMADAGTTSHIARDHLQDYVQVAGRVTAIIHDLVIKELEAQGHFCQCTCAACSLGVCVCAVAGRAILAEPWLAAKPPVAEHGIPLHVPRPGSAADAVLQSGDVVVAVDGQHIETLPHLQQALYGGATAADERERGALVPVTVRRGREEITLRIEYRRDGSDLNEDECLLPSGQDFYLDQAKNVQRRLRRSGSDATAGVGLAALSPREIQVVRLLGLGATNPMIAEELEISRPTVARHVQNILAKLGLANRIEAASVAAREGLLDGP